jgi:tetratricopeptide (TPR) repeat protein
MNNVKDLIAIAQQATSSGDYDEALRMWREVVILKPTADAYCNLGQIAEETAQWNEAQQAYETASSIAPQFYLPLVFLGLLALIRTDIERDQALAIAKVHLIESIKRKETAVAFSTLGTVERELGSEKHARQALKRALELDPFYEEALLHLAEIEKERDPIQAKALLERALEKDPNYGAAHQEYGKLLQKEGALDKAIQHFEQSVKINPNDYWSQLFLANALALVGQSGRADAAFQRAIEIDPGNSEGRSFYTMFLESRVPIQPLPSVSDPAS